MRDLEPIRQSFIELWGTLGPLWGISPTAARIYSFLMSRADAADSDEIMKALELSRGAVSMGCRELREWHLISPEKVAGSRRLAFRPATDPEKIIRNIVQVRKRREWDPMVESLHEWIPKLEESDSPDAAIFRERLEALERLLDRADRMIEVFLKGGLVGRFGLKLLVEPSEKKREKTPTARVEERS